KLAAASGFAHAPVGSSSFRPTKAWPNARDLIHQQMNVASIRRAYEGGLRLMFASATDDQVLAALLSGPNVDGAFVPDPAAAGAAVSESYGLGPARYLSVEARADYGRPLGWPPELMTMSPPLYVDTRDIPFSWYRELCYEPLSACAGKQPVLASFIEFGQRNE